MKKKFDINNFVWFLILLGLFFYFCRLIQTREVVYFINPKMYKYVYIGATAMGIMTVYQLFSIYTYNPSTKLKAGNIMFVIPLVLGLMVNPRGLNADAVENRGVEALLKGNISAFSYNTKKMLTSERMRYIKDNEVIISNDNYYRLMEDIYENLDLYIGKSITVTGFVYREDNFPKGQFLAGRMLMNCCAADAQVLGFMCKSDTITDIDKEKWVMVTGTIEVGEKPQNHAEGEGKFPVIKVENISMQEEPVNKYIYP